MLLRVYRGGMTVVGTVGVFVAGALTAVAAVCVVIARAWIRGPRR